MRLHLGLAVLTAGLTLAAASSAQAPTARTNLCYMRCQYQCYAAYPGGGPAWQQCYATCAATECPAGS